jgi:hypothetical protein
MYKAYREKGYKTAFDADELEKASNKDRLLGIFSSQFYG